MRLISISRKFLAFGIAFLGVFATAFAAEPSDTSLPRYKLQLGQELRYAGESEFKYEGGRYGTRDTWTVWVVRQNPDGGWRLIIRNGNEFASAREARKPAVTTPPANETPAEAATRTLKELADKLTTPAEDPGIKFSGKEDVSFAWCDMSPSGRIAPNDSFGFRMRPGGLFSPLPGTGEELAAGWAWRDERMDDTQKFKRSDVAKEGAFVFDTTSESPMNAIYGMELTGTVTFDLARGFPERVDSRTVQTYGFNGQGTGSTKLIEVKQHPVEWCATFIADTDRYFVARKAYDDAIGKKSLTADEIQTAYDQGKKELQAASDAIGSLELKALIENLLASEAGMLKYRQESATDRLAVLGTVSEPWATTDFAGKPQALKDYEGQVVILDFWYRGCGWCVRAMPQMKQVSSHFQGKPVAVLGMNTDRKDEDAQFVIDKMALNYANLKATGLPEKYKVRGFPTLIILDQKGVVRDIHVGYSPTLRDEIVAEVEKLLAKPE